VALRGERNLAGAVVRQPQYRPFACLFDRERGAVRIDYRPVLVAVPQGGYLEVVLGAEFVAFVQFQRRRVGSVVDALVRRPVDDDGDVSIGVPLVGGVLVERRLVGFPRAEHARTAGERDEHGK